MRTGVPADANKIYLLKPIDPAESYITIKIPAFQAHWISQGLLQSFANAAVEDK